MSPSPPYRKHAGPLAIVCLVLTAVGTFLAARSFMFHLWATCAIDLGLVAVLGWMFRYWFWRTATGVQQRAWQDRFVREMRERREHGDVP